VRWFLASLFFHVMSHYAIYGFLSLYLDARGYGKGLIGALWAVSVLVEIGWFFLQGRWMHAARMPRWLLLCGVAMVARMALTAGAADWLLALVVAQALHALTFATHHTACIAIVTRHFPGRLRGRGQALFTLTGYGLGGVVGVVGGGAVVSRLGFESLYVLATGVALVGVLCAWRMDRLERSAAGG
jgi:PPP family 3-phenylpropionic acid transporter